MTFPKGCISLSELEKHMQKIVLKDKKFAKFKPFGKRSKSYWEKIGGAEYRAETETRRQLTNETPDLFQIARGIAVYLFETLILTDEDNNGIFLYHNNSLTPVSSGDGLGSPKRLLLVEDAAVAPEACASKEDALGFAEFGYNRLNNQVFVEPRTWTVRDHPRFDLCIDHKSRDYCNQIWNNLHGFSGAIFVYRQRSNSLNEGWVTKSKIDWEASHKMNKLLNPLPTPKRDRKNFNQLVDQATAHYLSLGETEKLKFSKSTLAEVLGYPGMPTDNSGLRTIMNAVLQSLPVEDRERLKIAGRKPN